MVTKEQIKEREEEKSMSDVIGSSPVGIIEKIPNLKKRQRSVYYRPINQGDGTVDWETTKLLPSDAQGRELYQSKGFRLSLPSNNPATPEVDSEKDSLIARNKELENQLKMAKAREARGKEKT
jgi:hypothetical protein